MKETRSQDKASVSSNEIGPKNLVSNAIFDFRWSTHFAPLFLSWLVNWRRPGLRELISKCSTANIDFLLRSWNNKQYNNIKKVFQTLWPTYFTYLGAGSIQNIFVSNSHNNELVKFSGWSNPLDWCSDHFPCWLHWPGDINKDLTVWLDGARLPPKYVFKNAKSLMNLKIWPTWTLHQLFDWSTNVYSAASMTIYYYYFYNWSTLS